MFTVLCIVYLSYTTVTLIIKRMVVVKPERKWWNLHAISAHLSSVWIPILELSLPVVDSICVLNFWQLRWLLYFVLLENLNNWSTMLLFSGVGVRIHFCCFSISECFTRVFGSLISNIAITGRRYMYLILALSVLCQYVFNEKIPLKM